MICLAYIVYSSVCREKKHRLSTSYRAPRGPTSPRSVGWDTLRMYRSCIYPTDPHMDLRSSKSLDWDIPGTHRSCRQILQKLIAWKGVQITQLQIMSAVWIPPSADHRETPPYMLRGRPARIAARLSSCHLRTASKTQIMPSRRTCDDEGDGSGGGGGRRNGWQL